MFQEMFPEETNDQEARVSPLALINYFPSLTPSGCKQLGNCGSQQVQTVSSDCITRYEELQGWAFESISIKGRQDEEVYHRKYQTCY